VLGHVEGSLVGVVALFAVAGLVAWSDDIAGELLAHLSPEGVAAVSDAGQVCALGAALGGRWARTGKWTASGVPMSVLLESLPRTGRRLAEMDLGHRPPLSIPTRLWGALNDDVIPYSSLQRLSRRWGVPLRTRRIPRIPGRTGANHILPYFLHAPGDVRWLVSRLGG